MTTLKRQQFRSSREKVTYCTGSFCVMAALIFPASLFDVQPITYYGYFFTVAVVSVSAWLGWLRWGRQAFPLPSPDESQSAA